MADFRAWLAAVRRSHDRMAALVGGLTDEQIGLRSYADEWSLARVASHLGSQAEIADLFLTAGLTGAEAPGEDTVVPIWDRWNALPPRAQIGESVKTNEHLVSRLEGLTQAEQASFVLALFGTELDIAGLVALRLGEHALHTWDIAVTLDPAATVAQDAVDLLVDTLPGTAARAGTPVPGGRPLVVETTEPARTFVVTLDPQVALTTLDGDPDESAPVVSLPAEAFVRLVAGRLDPDHTPAGVEQTDRLEQLRTAFPGF